jgi:AcrR family transcriptional regulator
MSEVEKKERRKRRTKLAIEKDVLAAVSSMIEEVGFRNVTLTGVAQRAQIEPIVFYRRYTNLENLFDLYTSKFDYWLSNIADTMPSGLNDEQTFQWIMRNLIFALNKNKGMQQLLIWELSDNNSVTQKTAMNREISNQILIKVLEEKFQHTGIDINVIASLVISGIYYLILHKDISTFCNVDFSKKSGMERLEKAVDSLVSFLFSIVKMQHENLQIAERLRAEGISEHIIAKCIGNR